MIRAGNAIQLGIDQFMKTFSLLHRTAILLVASAATLAGAADSDYQPELFARTRLVYADTFDRATTINTNFWEIRQHSTWQIRDGVLTGSQSSKEFQQKMIAKGDKAHAGFKPVIWLRQVPENFVCTMRLRYSAKDYHPRFPLLDLGHHIHTLTFAADKTTLRIRKNVETTTINQPRLPLNEWCDIVIELKKGTLLLKINGRKHVFKSSNIDGTGHAQIDFKGVDFGTCEIDQIKVWEGL